MQSQDRRRQQGVNRVVMAVHDLEAGRAFYEEFLGCTFCPADDSEAAVWGIRVLMSWDGGVELVAPLPGADSHIEKHLAQHGEGLVGVVWAVLDADRSKQTAAAHGLGSLFTINYDQEQIDEKLQGRFSRYYEHFVAPGEPLGNMQVLVGEFDDRPSPA